MESKIKCNFVDENGLNMSKSISILDQDYILWIKDLSSRYRRSQIKAAVKVNQEMLQFYWDLGRDIVEKKAESRWGSVHFLMKRATWHKN